MKILFFLGYPNPTADAAWTRISFFANAWSKKGCSIEVLGVFTYKSLQKRGVRNSGNVNIFNLIFSMRLTHQARPRAPLIFAFNSFMSFIVSTFMLIARKPSIAIVSVPAGDVGLGALMACRLLDVKYVVDYRDEWEDYTIGLAHAEHKSEKRFYSAVKRSASCLYARACLAISVTSEFVDGLKLRGLTNVALIPNGADVNIFKPYDKEKVRRKLKLTEDRFVMVYSGEVGGYYQLDFLIRALAKLDKSLRDNVTLLIVGFGPDIPRIMGMAESLCLENSVLYLGEVIDKKELSEILSAADVGIIPGLYSMGQLPVKFFEYCACGIPVIAVISVDSLLAKLIRTYDVGAISSPIDIEKLAGTIYQLYTDNSFRKAAGKRARALIEEKFDRNKIAEEFLNLLSGYVISARGRAQHVLAQS